MLEAFFEYVREETFGKFGLQQIQVRIDRQRSTDSVHLPCEVDCAFIAEMIRDFLENEDVSVLDRVVPWWLPDVQDSLLDEVVASAQMRCLDPVLMEPREAQMATGGRWSCGRRGRWWRPAVRRRRRHSDSTEG